MSENIKPASDNTILKREHSKPLRIDLKVKEFDNLIEDQGVRVRITPSVLCPNRSDLHGTNHQLDCPVCLGDEVVDLKDECVETWVYIQSIHLTKNMEVAGVWDIKDAQMTVKAGIRLYYFYKIEILDFSSVFNQVIKRGVGDVDRTRYNPAPECDTPYYCIDNLGKRYLLNEHYKVEDFKLRWLGLVRPASGSLYSLSYPILPTFRVLEINHENRYYYTSFKSKFKTAVNLPQQAIIRLDYLAKGSGSNIER